MMEVAPSIESGAKLACEGLALQLLVRDALPELLPNDPATTRRRPSSLQPGSLRPIQRPCEDAFSS